MPSGTFLLKIAVGNGSAGLSHPTIEGSKSPRVHLIRVLTYTAYYSSHSCSGILG